MASVKLNCADFPGCANSSHHCYIALQLARFPPSRAESVLCFFVAICSCGPTTSLATLSSGSQTLRALHFDAGTLTRLQHARSNRRLRKLTKDRIYEGHFARPSCCCSIESQSNVSCRTSRFLRWLHRRVQKRQRGHGHSSDLPHRSNRAYWINRLSGRNHCWHSSCAG